MSDVNEGLYFVQKFRLFQRNLGSTTGWVSDRSELLIHTYSIYGTIYGIVYHEIRDVSKCQIDCTRCSQYKMQCVIE